MQSDLLQEINTQAWGLPAVKLSILRLDLLSHLGAGNKLFKLKYNLQQAKEEGRQLLLSFGGAWSNHIHALAALGHSEGFKTLGIIRGEPAHGLTPMLEDARAWGMEIHFVDRGEYRLRHDEEYWRQLRQRFGDCYVIPEGASNDLGASGCGEIINLLQSPNIDYQVLVTACGTGSTLAGLIGAAPKDKKLIGVAVLKGLREMEVSVADTAKSLGGGNGCDWTINHNYHHGGYAKVSEQLKTFILSFEKRHKIPLEPIYTGKLMYAVFDMIAKSEFNAGQHIIAVHSGGLQGRRGFDW